MTRVDEIFDIGLVDTEHRSAVVCGRYGGMGQRGGPARQGVAPASRG